MPTSSANDLHLVPLGAGDLIDRAVRLYRRHLLTLMRIASPPVIVSAIGSVLLTIGSRRDWSEPDPTPLLLLFTAGMVAYVPEVMLVDGEGVFESVSRSISLAKGNVRRLMAMTFFIFFATYSALMILVIPLGWYGYLNGIDPSPWNSVA